MLAPLLAPFLLAPFLLAPFLLTAPQPGSPPPGAAQAGRTSGTTASPGTAVRATSWLPPVGVLPVAVVRPFLAPPGPYAAGHRGVDLAAAAGDPVRAPAAGRVIYAGQVAGRPLVMLLHAGGVRTTYEPVAPSVAVGDRVAAGQVLGALVASGSHCLPSACLHWGARLGSGDAERYADPLALLAGQGPVRLLPLDGHRRGG
ncbi:MAG: murein hydrolase activator EnvC family protein [Motilibacteraceae bacterium]